MTNNQLVYVLVAISAIGFFVLPSTLSMFAGQHSWYDPKDGGIPCEKCHFLEAQEMSALVGPHTGETGYDRMECTYCHRGFEIGTGAIDPNFTSYYTNSSRVHAGQTLPCLYCHSGEKSGIVYMTPTIQHGISEPCYSCHDPPRHGDIFVDPDDCLKCHANIGTLKIYYVPPAKGFGLTQNTTDQEYGGNRSAHTKVSSHEVCAGRQKYDNAGGRQ
jgi:hypothetical protein